MSISGIQGSSDPYSSYLERRFSLNTAASPDSTATQAAAASSPSSSINTEFPTAVAPVSYAAQIKSDLSAVVSALQSGDSSSTQAALQTYQQDQQAFGASTNNQAPQGTGGAHGHHHHHHRAGQTQDPTNIETMDSSDPTSANPTTGSNTLDTIVDLL
jgi:hypothetical protein